jgi:uncharacterized protein YraI
MKVTTIVAALLLSAAVGVPFAEAAPGFATANVNLRAGPDTDYPSAGVIPESDPVDVKGCLRDESWCDVIWAGNRGWVFSEYLAMDYRGETRPLPDLGVAAFGIPVVVFAANDYWDHYYVGRPWYRDRNRWYAFKPRPRPGWRAPPPGPRKAGWWRTGGYHPPVGMKSPPDRGWHPRHPGKPNDKMKKPGQGPGPKPGDRQRGP